MHNMRAKLLTALVITTLGITSAAAQFGNPGGADPATIESSPGVPVPGQTNVPDRLFASLVTQGGMAEVELAKLATQKSRDESVIAFAKQMINDHGTANGKLVQLAKQMGLALPSDLAPDQKALKDHLSALDQAQFDLAYMRSQIVDHQKATQLFLWIIPSGESADMQKFASEALPTVLHHLQEAQELVRQLTVVGIAP